MNHRAVLKLPADRDELGTRIAGPGVRAALGAALLFGAGTPLAKSLLGSVDPWLLAGLLYLGSGTGLSLFRLLRKAPASRPQHDEWQWLLGAIVAGGVIRARPGPRHRHWHRHEPVIHPHAHFPDAHHRHRHGGHPDEHGNDAVTTSNRPALPSRQNAGVARRLLGHIAKTTRATTFDMREFLAWTSSARRLHSLRCARRVAFPGDCHSRRTGSSHCAGPRESWVE